MLSELRSRFDYVIIDSAPLLAVTDAAILAAKSDGALVVVRAGKTRRDQLAHAIGMLNDVGATLLGALLTMMPTRGSGAYSYNYYYYGGSYGDGGRGSAESRQSPDGVIAVTAVTAVDAIPDTAEHHHAGAGIEADESLGGRSAASD
jgi:receptor protein-tyrosine kinase